MLGNNILVFRSSLPCWAVPLSLLAAQCSRFPHLTCPAGSLYSTQGLLSSTHARHLQEEIVKILLVTLVYKTEKQRVEHPNGIKLYQ